MSEAVQAVIEPVEVAEETPARKSGGRGRTGTRSCRDAIAISDCMDRRNLPMSKRRVIPSSTSPAA
jgi:hypothetical protein